MLEGADLVFVAAGLGGGTGAGAAPVVATLAKELDALTIAIVTKPFTFEGGKRMRQAERSVDDLAASVDILTTIPNDRLLRIAPKGTSMAHAFRMADDVLRQAVEGISEIILMPGLINLDFSDIKAAISGMGYALIGNASAKGENAAVEATRAAINSPLLEDTRIKGARQVLMNITGSSDIGLHQLNEACSIIREAADCDDLQLNFGVIANDAMGDTVKVTIIATGFAPSGHPPAAAEPSGPAPTVRRRDPDFFTPREPEPVMEAAPAVAEPEPAPVVMETAPEAVPEPVYEEELDVPAYLRQGRLLG
jgi:cell division protein FtsZ